MKKKADESRLAPKMVEDRAMEKLKKRAQDLGLIVNAGADRKVKPTGKKRAAGDESRN